MRSPVTLLTLALLLGLAACAAPSSSSSRAGSGTTEFQRVSFRDYRNGVHLALVNEGSTDKVGFYSETRSDAATKVATNEVMDELLRYILKERGLEQLTSYGNAPVDGAGGSQSIEIHRGGQTQHAVAYAGMPLNEGKTFKECVSAVYQTYNLIYQLQAVETRPGQDVFQGPGRRR